MSALRAAGYQVFAINPMSAARYRERHSTSGAKSDAGDAHVLAEIVRLDRDHHRPIAGDSDLADAVRLWRVRTRPRSGNDPSCAAAAIGTAEYFPAAVQAFDDLAAADALTLLRARRTRHGRRS